MSGKSIEEILKKMSQETEIRKNITLDKEKKEFEIREKARQEYLRRNRMFEGISQTESTSSSSAGGHISSANLTYEKVVTMEFLSVSSEVGLPLSITDTGAWIDLLAPGYSGPGEIVNVVITGDTTIELFCNGVLDIILTTDIFAGMNITSITDDGFFEIIGENWFNNCANLTTVRLIGTLTLDSGAFANCSSLYSVEIPSMINIGDNAFSGCTSLLYMNSSLDNVITIGNSSFDSCTSLAEVYFANCQSLGDAVFKGSLNLTGIYLPSAISIGNTLGNDSVFQGISGNTITATFNNAVSYDADINDLGTINTVNITWV